MIKAQKSSTTSGSVAASPQWNKKGVQSVAASPQWKPKSLEEASPKGFSPFVAFCFTINYMLGTGFLTIPWAFVQGGLVFSSVVLICVCILSDITKGYILETMAFAELLLDQDMHWISKDKIKEKLLLYSPVSSRIHSSHDFSQDVESIKLLPPKNIDYQSLSAHNTTTPSTPGTPNMTPGTPNMTPGTPNMTPGQKRRIKETLQNGLIELKSTAPFKKPLVKERKFEINALCRIFLGKSGLYLYTFFLSSYIYCALWAYTCVFSSALAKALPFFEIVGDAYTSFSIIFAIVVIPLSCMELEEQITIQILLAFCRFCMVLFMVGTCRYCILPNEHGSEYDAPLVHISKIGQMLPIVVFATIYHHSIPGLAAPVEDKTKLSEIFRNSNLFSGLSYIFIGCVIGYTFGLGIEQSSNLHWKHYVNEDTTSSAWYDLFISYYVVLFPAMDVVSAFPLCAITLGNNLLNSYFGRRVHEVEQNRCILIAFRLIASVPPILLGLSVRELGTITDYAGTLGFVITFCFPAILYIKSVNKAQEKGFDNYTLYSMTCFSNVYSALFLCFFGLCMFFLVCFLIFNGE